ncbi:hypothetical protein D3C87_104180 [compost metagenome]
MTILFQNDTAFNTMNLVSDTWMCLKRGEGEKEIANHGWSRVISFSQETGAIGQQRSRSDQNEPKLYSQSQVQDAHDSPTQLPFFSFSNLKRWISVLSMGLQQQGPLLRTVLALVFFPFNVFSRFAVELAKGSAAAAPCSERVLDLNTREKVELCTPWTLYFLFSNVHFPSGALNG